MDRPRRQSVAPFDRGFGFTASWRRVQITGDWAPIAIQAALLAASTLAFAGIFAGGLPAEPAVMAPGVAVAVGAALTAGWLGAKTRPIFGLSNS